MARGAPPENTSRTAILPRKVAPPQPYAAQTRGDSRHGRRTVSRFHPRYHARVLGRARCGPSGCGKTTLLRIIGGLLRPTAGEALIEARAPAEAQRNRGIGYIFQDPALLPWRSVLGNIRLPLEIDSLRGRELRDPEGLLDLVGLAGFGRYYPQQLSGGMQHRVALARALVFNPDLLLMDEPFGALDEITRSEMRYELLQLWDTHSSGTGRKTAVFVTHSIAEAVTLSDRVVVLSGRPGTVLADIELASGDALYALLIAANRDPARAQIRRGSVRDIVGRD